MIIKLFKTIALAVVTVFFIALACIVIMLLSRPPIYSPKHIVFSPDGDIVAFQGWVDAKPAVAVFEAATRKKIAILRPSTPTVNLMFSADSNTLIAYGRQEVVSWDTKTWNMIERTELSLPQDIMHVKLAPDGKRLAFLQGLGRPSLEKSLKIWDVLKDVELCSISLGSDNIIYDLTFSNDGRLLAMSPEGRVRGKVLDVVSCDVIFEFDPVKNDATGSDCMDIAAFSPDSRTLAVSERDQHVISLWDVPAHKRKKILKGHADEIIALAFSSDGTLLASGASRNNRDGDLKIWTLTDGKEIFTLKLEDLAPMCVAFSPNGKTLAYGMPGKSGDLRFLDTEDFSKTKR
jgi:WD40 repeat protein